MREKTKCKGTYKLYRKGNEFHFNDDMYECTNCCNTIESWHKLEGNPCGKYYMEDISEKESPVNNTILLSLV